MDSIRISDAVGKDFQDSFGFPGFASAAGYAGFPRFPGFRPLAGGRQITEIYLIMRIKYFAFVVLFVGSLAGCHRNAAAPEAESYEYTDDYGCTVSVPTHPQRIVSLSPAVTEIMFALGADSLLVGRTEFCAYPPDYQWLDGATEGCAPV